MIQTAPKPAQAYQLLPALADDQRDALRQSIEENGILQPIEVDEDGRILDGHHRAAIAADLGIACPSRTINNLDEPGKRRYALTVNLMRRQLDRAARGALVAKLRAEGMTVRTIAEEIGLPKSTVSDDLRQLSDAGQLIQPERIVGRDGKERPAARPQTASPVPNSEPAPSVRSDDQHVGERKSTRTAPQAASEFESNPTPGPALPWPVVEDTPPHPAGEPAHAARVSNDIRRLITLAQTFGSDELRQQAIRLYADNLGNAPMPPSGVVNAQELRKAADAIAALAKDWNKKK